MADATTICFVACVESGPLEAQTVRLAESIRRFGGALADSEIIAVTARFGPPLARTTQRRFKELGVRHERVASHPTYSWYHYLNKPLGLQALESRTDADLMAFIDSDVVFLDEPSALVLAADEDFAACAPDLGVVGSTGPDSPHDADWARLCALFGMDIEDLPWLTTGLEGERIRFYFNSGVFVYRRGIGFSQRYLDMCTKTLDTRFGFAHNGVHMMDQLCLGLAVLAGGLRWRALPYSHNTALVSDVEATQSLDHLREATILHYHDAMGPAYWPKLLADLEATRPEAYAWLRDQAPLTDPAPPPWRLLRQGLRVARGVPRRRYRLSASAL